MWPIWLWPIWFVADIHVIQFRTEGGGGIDIMKIDYATDRSLSCVSGTHTHDVLATNVPTIHCALLGASFA